MKPQKKIFFALFVLLSLVIVYLAVYNVKNAGPANGFTELYFVGELPKEIEINADYNFSFAIHNLENRNMTYNYNSFLKSELINSGMVTLENNKTMIISQTFKVKNKGNDLMPITVKLLDKGQEIHFWVKLK